MLAVFINFIASIFRRREMQKYQSETENSDFKRKEKSKPKIVPLK
jgi:hypothetical protein